MHMAPELELLEPTELFLEFFLSKNLKKNLLLLQATENKKEILFMLVMLRKLF